MSNSELPKIFISYSWSPIKNKNWVLNLAERLTQDGIRVVIDEWDAHEGQDKYVFMEQMVKSPDIQYVLLICNKEYSKKADNRDGGVGIESQIISSEIYSNVDQKKFIPIVRERSEEGSEFLPTFLSTRFYIDLCDSESYEENYESLVRRIFNKPKNRRPSLGNPPSYISQDDPVFLQTAHIMRPLKLAIEEGGSRMRGSIETYFEKFLITLEDFVVIEPQDSAVNLDDVIVDRFEELRALRDDYIIFLRTYLKYNRQNNEEIFDFFERLINKIQRELGSNVFNSDHKGHFNLLATEIFIYTITLLIEYKKYVTAGYLLNNKYAFENGYGEINYLSFGSLFNLNIHVIEETRNRRLNYRKVSLAAMLIKDRATLKGLDIDVLAQTDALLHYSSLLNFNSLRENWIPKLLPYRTIYNRPRLIQMMKSKQKFENIKHFWGVHTKEEFFKKIECLDVGDIYSSGRMWNYNISEIQEVFKQSEICSL